MSEFDAQITFVKVDDLDAADRFYGGLLGLPLALDQGACRIYRVTDSAYLGFCRRGELSAAAEGEPGDRPEPGHPAVSASGREAEPPGAALAARSRIILTLVIDDVDGRYEELSRRGAVFEHPPAPNPKFRIYHCFLRDPEGYLVEIQRFEDPAWPAPSHRS